MIRCDSNLTSFVAIFYLSEHTENLPSTRGSLGRIYVFIRLIFPKTLRDRHYKITVKGVARLKTG